MSEIAEEIKARQRKVWTLGNYPEIAKVLQPASVALADACGIEPGTTLLDVGTGTGNLALEAARRGATVVATDLTPEMIEVGKERSQEENLLIEWSTADAEDLGFEDDRFDVVTSVFGAMFAPRAWKVAEEMLRVTKPGGLVGFTSWAGDGFTGMTFKLSAEFAPPTPVGYDNAGSWGDEGFARERFEEHGAEVEIRSGLVTWDFASLPEARSFIETNAPPMVAAKKAMPPDIFEEMMKGYEALQIEFNRGTGGRVTIDSRFLMTIARKPA
ncbi:MAG: class I SAM-dependent methyltransferase [Actinomycetota bacterium]